MIILGLLLTLLCLVPTGIIFYNAMAETLSQEIERELQLESLQRIRQLDQFLLERWADLNVLSAEGSFLNDPNLPLVEKVNRLRDFEKHKGAYVSISIYNRQGVKIGDSRNLNIGDKANAQAYFTAAINGQRHVDSKPLISSTLGVPVLHFSAPLGSNTN